MTIQNPQSMQQFRQLLTELQIYYVDYAKFADFFKGV